MQPGTQLQVIRSVISADALPPLLETHYDLETPVTCHLLHAGDNDTYLVRAGRGKYVLRIYWPGHYWIQGTSDYRFELDWLAFLHKRGLPVSYAIPCLNGDLLGKLDAPEGIRCYALFTYAPGRFIYPLDPEQHHILGQKVAEIHLASNDFECAHQRFRTDLHFLLDEPLTRIATFLGDRKPDDMIFLVALVQELKKRILDLGISGDGFGLIGGDFHGGNNHFDTDNKPTFFDFDLCGYGWRAYDLSVLLRNARFNGSPPELGQAFLEGYQTVRPLSQSEQAAIPLFVMARTIMRMGVNASESAFKGDIKILYFYWDTMIKGLRKWKERDL